MVTLLKRIYWVETKWNGNWDDWNQNAISQNEKEMFL